MSTNFRRWAALVVVCFGQLMIVLDTTIVNVALGSMQRDLHLGQADLTWVVNAYLIAYAGFLLVAGRAGDLIGRRKVFLAGIFVFTVASFGTGLARSAESIIVGRFIQGLGGSLAAGVILAIIVSGFRSVAERTRALGLFALVAAAGGSLGLLAGGALTQFVSWHWIFFINVPIGIATMVFGALLIDENESPGLQDGIDAAGTLLVVASVVLGVYAIVTAAGSGWQSAHTFAFGGAALTMFAVFLAVETRHANPLMPLRILGIRSLTGASAVRAFLFAAMSSTFFAGSLYLQHVKRFDAVGIGLAFLPTTVALAALPASGVTARLMARFGAPALVAAGLMAITGSLWILSGADAASDYFPRLFGAYLLFGVGAGAALLPLITISMSDVATAEAGLATGFGNVVTQLGAAFGLAVTGTLATARTAGLVAAGVAPAAALTSGYQLAFALAGATAALGILVVLLALRNVSGRRDAEITVEQAEAEAA
jgi:EmrB/QacA subfamily drug resistance transporter